MAKWSVWEPAYSNLTLVDDGDPMEQEFAKTHDLGQVFPNYEVFWRYHVAPATNRPVDINHRPNADPVVCKLMTLHHSVLSDLYDSVKALATMRQGDYGDRQKNFKDFVKYGGDALQKFSDLQQVVIEKELSTRVLVIIQVWSQQDWNTKWKPWRDRNVKYRSYLTHVASSPQIILVTEPDGKQHPYALKRDSFVQGPYPTWNDQKALFHTKPVLFARLADVCEELYSDTMAWLNAAYGEVIRWMSLLLQQPGYRRLWSWYETPPPCGSGIGFGYVGPPGLIASGS